MKVVMSRPMENRILNTGRAKSPQMWAVQFGASGTTSGSSGNKLTLNNNKINN